MKYTNKWLMALLPAALLSSCAEDVFEPYQVDKPASIAEQEYLAGYNTLQSYTQLKLSADADFKAYNSKGALYNIVTSNFSEISAAATANHLALVDEKTGIVNSSAIYDLVGGAKAANQSVFGTAILGNTEVNGKYLQKLVADKVDPNAKGAPKIKYDSLLVYNADCEGEVKDDEQSFSTNSGCSFEIAAGKGKDGGKCVAVKHNGKTADRYGSQFFITFSTPVPAGTEIEINMDIKADQETSDVGTQAHKKPTEYLGWNTFGGEGTYKFTTEWTSVTFKAASPSDDCQTIAFDLGGADANTFYFDNMKIHATLEIDAPAQYPVDIAVNGSFEGDDISNYLVAFQPAAKGAGEGKGGGDCLKVPHTEKQSDGWKYQFFIKFAELVPSGTEIELTMDIKADNATGDCTTQAHSTPGNSVGWCPWGTVKFTTDWTTFSAKATVGNDCQALSIDLGAQDPTNFYFDNVKVVIIKENKSSIPLTPEEKQANLNGALDKWIGGIFEGADGYINDWILFNGIFDKDGNFKNKEVKADNEFVWQSYYDDPDAYLHGIAKRARDLGAKKLFVSETELNNGGKLSKVLDWIKAFGTDEASTIEGIDAKLGSIEFKDDMSDWKKSYEDMLSGLAASGKLIRISGISIDDKNAKEVAQQKAIGEFYAYIVAKYVELIPSAQQYGVSLPTSGLWKDNARTHQYGSLADGLK